MTEVYGNPLWSRTASLESYGGHANKRNFGGIDVVDATTDVGADQVNRLAADMAAAALVLPLIVMPVTYYAALPCPVFGVSAQWGISGPYSGDSPPTGMPEVTSTGTALYVQLPATMADQAGVTYALMPRIGVAGSIVGSVNLLTGLVTFPYPVDGTDYLVRLW